MQDSEFQDGKPKRHGCLTTFLVLMIITSSIISLVFLFGSDNMIDAWPSASPTALIFRGIIGLFNVVFAIALFKWKKWGFIGIVITSIFAVLINLEIGLGIGQSLLGLSGVAILYWTLQIGKERKAWPHLE